MIASRIAFLFAAAAILAGCSVPVRADQAVNERLVIRGEMFSPERLALTPDCVAIVELRADEGPRSWWPSNAGNWTGGRCRSRLN